MLHRGRGRKISRALCARLTVPEFTVGKLATMCTVQSTERVAREDSLLEFPVPFSHGSKDSRSRYRRYIYAWQLRSGATPSRLAS